MLGTLSLRNARRQSGAYALFFVTLSCAVAVMYAFHTLIFSDTVASLPDMEVLPWLIITASVLITLILGQITSYMIHNMLKRRSREFALYMLSGISARDICRLIFLENCLIGLLSFLPGMISGMLFAQILEAILFHMFGLPYTLHIRFTPPAAGLTFPGFAGILLYSVRKNRRWIRRIQLRELLNYDRENETAPVTGSRCCCFC